jgi:thiol-disulfide isomerase/thioredoxin
MNLILRPLALSLLVALPFAARAEDSFNPVLAPHAQDLVSLQGEQLTPFKSDDFLKARYTILYFSAGWCIDCRKFSPSLVSAYDAQQKGADRFEVLLLTRDKSEKDMLQYMRHTKMKWPALAFDKVAGADDLKKFYSGYGIPCLTVIDQKGAVVLQSKSDQDAKTVLKQLQDLLATHA